MPAPSRDPSYPFRERDQPALPAKRPGPASVGLTTQERRNIQQILGISIRPQAIAHRALALHRRLVEGGVIAARQRLTTHHAHRRRLATRSLATTARMMRCRRMLLAFP